MGKSRFSLPLTIKSPFNKCGIIRCPYREGGDPYVAETLPTQGNSPLQGRLLTPVPGKTLNCPTSSGCWQISHLPEQVADIISEVDGKQVLTLLMELQDALADHKSSEPVRFLFQRIDSWRFLALWVGASFKEGSQDYLLTKPYNNSSKTLRSKIIE
jgi:hypothetical protein